MRGLRSHLSYANVMSTLAVALVIGGGAAYAANTVFSEHIGNNAVYGADVRDDTLAGGGLGHVDIKGGAVRSSEVGADSLSGADIVESSLGEVPSARLGGLGGDTPGGETGAFCNPESTTPITCVQTGTINLD